MAAAAVLQTGTETVLVCLGFGHCNILRAADHVTHSIQSWCRSPVAAGMFKGNVVLRVPRLRVREWGCPNSEVTNTQEGGELGHNAV